MFSVVIVCLSLIYFLFIWWLLHCCLVTVVCLFVFGFGFGGVFVCGWFNCLLDVVFGSVITLNCWLC